MTLTLISPRQAHKHRFPNVRHTNIKKSYKEEGAREIKKDRKKQQRKKKEIMEVRKK